jgi:eukaryotic-like serine/threonine-protein kinase
MLMPRDCGAEDLSLGLDQALRIHRICEAFECGFPGGDRPRIEAFLEQADGEIKGRLLEELLLIELDLRRRLGEVPSLSEYLSRFPDDSRRVAAAFSLSAQSPASPDDPGDDPDATRPYHTGDSPQGLAPTDRAPAISSDSNRPLDFVGNYELVEEIARGGMGIVYKARDIRLKRMVALKMILSGQRATADERGRFRREAELAGNLDHPNIVRIFEVEEFEGCPFFVMQLVEGDSLAKQIKKKERDKSPYEPKAAARLMVTIARAVHYAHKQGFLHCDLKPSNILIDREGRPLVTDFGLARRTSEDSSLTISGAILGTPSYMAPEQATGSRKQLNPGTDVYGLGAILYELLTGRAPFRAGTIMETVVDVLERDPAPLRTLRPEVPKELESICLKCLEKAPHDRYNSADTLADELERFLQGEVIDATTLIPRLRRWNRREPELVARLGGLGLIALIAHLNYLFFTDTPNFWLHYRVEAVLGLWAASALMFQVFLRTGWRSDHVRVLWSAADILFLTLELKLFESWEPIGINGDRVVRFETTLLVGYPLMIAASGLWWRVTLVWITTLLATIAYCGLYVDTALTWRAGHVDWRPSPDLQHSNIFLAGLVLTGYVVARQVKRILLLSQYYEHRPPA